MHGRDEESKKLKEAGVAPDLVTYNFPINEPTSIKFHIRKVKIVSAELEVNGRVLSKLNPLYDESWTPSTITELNFFSHHIFCNHLVAKCTLAITMEVDERLPELLLEPCGTEDTYGEYSVAVLGKQYMIVYVDHETTGLKPVN